MVLPILLKYKPTPYDIVVYLVVVGGAYFEVTETWNEDNKNWYRSHAMCFGGILKPKYS